MGWEAESGFDSATPDNKRTRLAAVPGGARQHARIIKALANFRELTLRLREREDAAEGGVPDGNEGGGDGTTAAATTSSSAVSSGDLFILLPSFLG